MRLVMWLLSAGVRRRARQLGVDDSFLFMKASGSPLREITRLVEAGRAKGKVVVKLK